MFFDESMQENWGKINITGYPKEIWEKKGGNMIINDS